MMTDTPTFAGLSAWSAHVRQAIGNTTFCETLGRVVRVTGTLLEAAMPTTQVGELCVLKLADGHESLAEVIGFTEQYALLSALEPLEGVSDATLVKPLRRMHTVDVSDALLGQVLDGFGRPFETPDVPIIHRHTPVTSTVLQFKTEPLQRPPISEAFWTGVRVVDSTLTLGVGQRAGLFAGPGCGKTTLLASIARGAKVDVIVFALVGERGRELREFLERELDPELRARTVVVCSTSDRTSMERARAALTATAIAEAFRDSGKQVLLMIDSLTRYARALREIGLAAGEPPTRNGYPPSVFVNLPRLIERAGNTPVGSITALYTVLSEGETATDPISDEARSLLDGHIILSRKLAERAYFPAVDVLASLSRVMNSVANEKHNKMARTLRGLLSRYNEVELLLRLNEYQRGREPFTDFAVDNRSALETFLQQSRHDNDDPAVMLDQFSRLLQGCPAA